MILQALTEYYDVLRKEKKVPERGFSSAKVSYAIDLRPSGEVKGILTLLLEQKRGKKTVSVPQNLTVPRQVKRTSGISPNFMCDNSKYILGIAEEGKEEEAIKCFEASREKHCEILADCHDTASEAVKNFFKNWKPEQAKENPLIQDNWEGLIKASNFVFEVDGEYAQEDEEIRHAWLNTLSDSDDEQGICLVTGQKTGIARIHTAIKGVPGSQSSGAALVSFNFDSAKSFEKDQSFNAPIGEEAEFAYTTALNYLLSQRDEVIQLGETTVVCWAASAQKQYTDAFLNCMNPTPQNQEEVERCLKKMQKGEPVQKDQLTLDPKQPFFILGLGPNASRLVVRFFYRDTFGNTLEHLQAHYERMKLVRPVFEQQTFVSIWRALYETVNDKSKDKSPAPILPGNYMRAVLSDTPYPQQLYSGILIRIRADKKVNWQRASVLKAFLIKNYHWEEGTQYSMLNEESRDRAYVLGRLFAVLEAIQEQANPGINATIKDRYFNAACGEPAVTFAQLLKLSNSHLHKLTKEQAIYYKKMLGELMDKLDDFPKKLTLEEQGRFILGYYHQTQRRFTKKEDR